MKLSSEAIQGSHFRRQSVEIATHPVGIGKSSAHVRVMAPFPLPYSKRREARLKPDSVQLQPLPGAPVFPPAYPNAEEAISKIVYVSVRVRARVLSGRLTGQAMPGLFAKEIVPQSCGMRSITSAFRHFSARVIRNSNEPALQAGVLGANPSRANAPVV